MKWSPTSMKVWSHHSEKEFNILQRSAIFQFIRRQYSVFVHVDIVVHCEVLSDLSNSMDSQRKKLTNENKTQQNPNWGTKKCF